MKNQTISFIGAGNMASCLMGGLIQKGCPPETIWAASPDTSQLRELQQKWRIHTTTNNDEAVEQADVLIFAVKPQIIKQVTKQVGPAVLQKKPLIISVVAGAKSSQFENWLNPQIAIVRCMPNTPALYGVGATVMYANPAVTEEKKIIAESILSSVGITAWIAEENLMNAVTSLSGSGPAYFFIVMEAIENAAVDLGLPRPLAKLLTAQTALGSAQMAIHSKEDIPRLREQVTSPGGGTEQALNVLETKEIRKIFKEALEAACQRYVELSKLLEG